MAKTNVGSFSVALNKKCDIRVIAKTHKSVEEKLKRKGVSPQDMAIFRCFAFGKTNNKPPFPIRKEHHSALKQLFDGLLPIR